MLLITTTSSSTVTASPKVIDKKRGTKVNTDINVTRHEL